MPENKKIIGILGGIGSGKSTVAKLFAEKGCAVIDADRLAHEVLERESIKNELRNHFGDVIFGPDGELLKPKMAEIAFQKAEHVQKLNELIHPPVKEMVAEKINEYQKNADIRAIILDVPLLLEAGWEKMCDFLIFISCNDRKRIERAEKKGDFFKNQLKLREKFQISLDKKAEISHYTINNNSGLSSLQKQIEEIISIIL